MGGLIIARRRLNRRTSFLPLQTVAYNFDDDYIDLVGPELAAKAYGPLFQHDTVHTEESKLIVTHYR